MMDVLRWRHNWVRKLETLNGNRISNMTLTVKCEIYIFPPPDLAFRGAHRHVPMTRDLAHWDVIEALEKVCVYDVFKVYGVTDHQDKHRLKVDCILRESAA